MEASRLTRVVVSLHLHPDKSGEPLKSVNEIQVVKEKGILGEPRFFGRLGRDGLSSKRQVSLMEREQIDEHASAFGIEILPGRVRSNIETTGVKLVELVNRNIQIGDAVLHISEARTPCTKMDAICHGLREASGNGRLGVIAQVIRSGTIRVGDEIVAAEVMRL